MSQRLTLALPRIQWPSFGVWRANPGNEILVEGSHQSKRPGFYPGRLLFAHRMEVVTMKRLLLLKK